ncbi:hypothetical protein EMPS_01804 [Entomortierella parvispora]|uniref:Uncharacterized protein n=1 Tax=Entomortierella parvispora TaxID=205924 RepID=A0A9P3LSY6_9FUNG|nr:hypothetical protein EMPS_01804 [Entomortierella parvispora]
MCKRITCQDCGKFTWTGCGLHITEVLEGLPLEQICKCDDDFDSEKKWQIPRDVAPLVGDAAAIASLNPAPAGLSRPAPRYPLAFNPSSSSSTPDAGPISSAAAQPVPDLVTHANPMSPDQEGAHVGEAHCPDPSPVEYRLSKISSTSATVAAVRMAQQAAALEELRRIKQRKEQELKEANENALQKLLQGLTDASDKQEDA